jgi:hypothetical protein
MDCDCRRVFDWWPDLLDSLIQCVTTLYSSPLYARARAHTHTHTHTHTLLSTLTSLMLLLRSGFNCWRPLPLGSRTVPGLSYHLLTVTSQNQTYIRLKVRRPVYLGVKNQSGAQDQICITVRLMWVRWGGALSLTRVRVCRLQLRLALASAVILESESRRTHDHIAFSQIRDSFNLESQVPVFISPRNRVVQLYTQVLGSLFFAFYDSQGCGWDIRTSLHGG